MWAATINVGKRMARMIYTSAATMLLVVFGGSWATQAHAQNVSERVPSTVVSTNPLALLLGIFNAEIEYAVSAHSTAGIGGSGYNGANDSEFMGLVWH